MAKPRNTIETEYPLELRLEIAQWLLDAVGYSEIKTRLAERGIEHLPHNSSFLAYQRGLEFSTIREDLVAWKRKAAERAARAKLINEGRGPESLADLAQYHILEQLDELASGGLLATGEDVARVATAISNQQRTLIAAAESARRDHVDRLKREHAAQTAELTAEIARAKAHIEKLVAALEKKDGTVDSARRSEMIDAVNDFVRGPLYG